MGGVVFLLFVFSILIVYAFALWKFGGPVVELFNGEAKRKRMEIDALVLATVQIAMIATLIILVMR